MSYTYTTLKQAIQDYTENNEATFVRNLPLFIRNTEERILKNVQLSLFQKNSTGIMTDSIKFLTCPTDFLAPLSLAYTDSNSNQVFLDFKDADFLQSFNPNPATTGSPRYYGQFDVDNFIISPTPNSGYAVELHYFYRPFSLTKSSFTLTLTSVSGTFSSLDTITGSTSGQSSGVDLVPSSTTLTVVIPSGDYVVGETVTGSVTGATGIISSIGSDTTESWLSENAEVALLYGSLMEAYVFMKGEQDLQVLYEKRFGEAIMGLKMLGESSEVTDEYRTGQIVRAKQ
tara:strand:- start:174 stop:1031 length:858 start_codon:yes stop_codon:yes gene_type:complete